MNRKNIDSYFFHTWREESAYVLGFIFADGGITQDPDSPNLKVYLKNNDLELLERIKEAMKSDHKISAYKAGGYIFPFVDESIVHRLMELGVPRRKSEEWGIPDIPKEYLPHFIRGYFDGKGHFTYEKHNGDRRRMRSSFSVKSIKFAEWLADVLSGMGLKRANPLPREEDGGMYYELRYYVRDTKKLYDIMYRDATIFMKWKKEYYEAKGTSGRDGSVHNQTD